MKRANIIVISLCLSIFILTSAVHADVVNPDAPSRGPGSASKDQGSASKYQINSQLIITSAIIGIIAIIAWLMIRKIKKDSDSNKEPKTRV